ncbi:MAG: sugar transferase, partial [Holophagae bacterium]|nr:sugar transferase [Holophagae bacterium]
MKRLFDIIASLLALIVFLPIILLTAVLVRAKLGRPIFFKQIRPGMNGESFEMIKFRS